MSAQISQKQDKHNIYAIMKTMYPSGYYHNGFVALWQLMHLGTWTWCMVSNIYIYIYIYMHLSKHYFKGFSTGYCFFINYLAAPRSNLGYYEEAASLNANQLVII